MKHPFENDRLEGNYIAPRRTPAGAALIQAIAAVASFMAGGFLAICCFFLMGTLVLALNMREVPPIVGIVLLLVAPTFVTVWSAMRVHRYFRKKAPAAFPSQTRKANSTPRKLQLPRWRIKQWHHSELRHPSSHQHYRK